MGSPLPSNFCHVQRFDWRAPLAGNDLHELKAVVVELHLHGVVVLRVDLTGPQRATVLSLNEGLRVEIRREELVGGLIA